MNLNKGISTPIAILLIIAVSAVVGVLIWQFAAPKEESTPKTASDYTSQSACKEAGFYWYNDVCHKEQQSGATPSQEDFIKVASPNGGETWKFNEPHDIAWNSNLSSERKVKIIITENEQPSTIITQTTNTGSYSWDISETKVGAGRILPPGENYKIKICSLEDNSICDTSNDYFKIKKGTTANSFPEASLKTYTNEKYGFEFKYPENSETKEIPPSDPTGLKITLDEGDIVVQEINNSIINIDLPEDCMFSSDNLEEENMLNFAETKEVNGVDFNHYQNYPKYIDAYCGMSTGCTYKDVYRTFYNDKCYQVVYNRSEGNVRNIPEVFDQVLSSFQFTD